MVIGNPDGFSVLFEAVDKWNTPKSGFNNGLLLIMVDGWLFPREIQSSTLSRELWILHSQMRNLIVNEEIFSMAKDAAFQKMYDLVHPEDIDDMYEYGYCITPESFSDHGYFVFAVGNGSQVRILSCDRLRYDAQVSRHSLDDAVIREATISVKDYDSVAERIGTVLLDMGIENRG